METIRDISAMVQLEGRLDERLDAAQDLLQSPARNRLPGVVPLLAGCAFISAATLLAYVFTQSPALNPTRSKPVAAAKPAIPAGKADFELSGTPKEAVPVGSESAR
jgi:hypothetical protein